MPFELVKPPEPTGEYAKRITQAFKPRLKETRPPRTGELDTQLIQGLKKQTPKERALDYLTMGFVGGQGGYEKEVNFDPSGKMFRKDLPPTAEIPLWEDPILAGASGVVGALKAPGTLAARLLRGGAETLADVTGGASSIPGMLKNARGERLIPQLPDAGVPTQSRLRAPTQIKVISAPKEATKALKALPAPLEPKWEKWPGEYGMQEALIRQYPELGPYRKTLKAGQKIDVNNLHRMETPFVDVKEPRLKPLEVDQIGLKPAEPKPEAPPAAPTLKAPKRTRQGGKGPETIRGELQALGGVDFLNFKGELRDLPADVRRAIARKNGYPIDLAEEHLRARGYLEPGEDLLEMLRTDPQNTLRRRPNSMDITERERYLTPKEKKFKEDMEHEPEMPDGFDPDAPGDDIPFDVPKLGESARDLLGNQGGQVGRDVNPSKTLKELENKWKNRNVKLRLWDSNLTGETVIRLDHIEVPKGERKKGIGSEAIQDIIDYADQKGQRIELTPALKDDRFGTTSRSRLIKYYKRFGFVENKGRYKDFTTRQSMYRDPQNKFGLAPILPILAAGGAAGTMLANKSEASPQPNTPEEVKKILKERGLDEALIAPIVNKAFKAKKDKPKLKLKEKKK